MYKNRVAWKWWHIYKTIIPKDDYLLDFEKYFDEQPKNIQQSLNKIKEKYWDRIIDEWYRDIEQLNWYSIFEAFKDIYWENKASKILQDYWIKWNKYKFSSNWPDNYVIFDNKDMKINKVD